MHTYIVNLFLQQGELTQTSTEISTIFVCVVRTFKIYSQHLATIYARIVHYGHPAES